MDAEVVRLFPTSSGETCDAAGRKYAEFSTTRKRSSYGQTRRLREAEKIEAKCQERGETEVIYFSFGDRKSDLIERVLKSKHYIFYARIYYKLMIYSVSFGTINH